MSLAFHEKLACHYLFFLLNKIFYKLALETLYIKAALISDGVGAGEQLQLIFLSSKAMITQINDRLPLGNLRSSSSGGNHSVMFTSFFLFFLKKESKRLLFLKATNIMLSTSV
jgi:hypothetical protein